MAPYFRLLCQVLALYSTLTFQVMQETDEQKMIIITRYHLCATLMTELQCQKGPGISIIIRMHALIKVAYNNM